MNGPEMNPGRIHVVVDDISLRLDEMADLCEYWKRWREGRGMTPYAIRSALVSLSSEVSRLSVQEFNNSMFGEEPRG